MREYLFRGQRVDTKEWVEGFLTIDPTICEYVIDTVGSYSIPVIPETVGQFTGMTDKNGKRIFERDIVIFFNRKFVCEWNKVSCQFTLKNLDENFGFNYFCSAEIEVIGSIHDTEGGAE